MSILKSADTWFFEKASFGLDGSLVIEIVEGIQSEEKELVEIDDNNSLGPYYPVKVTENSSIVAVKFSGVLTYSTTNESYDIGDDQLIKKGKYLFECTNSRYLNNIKNSTSIDGLAENYKHYFLWTEDYLIDVIATESPIIEKLNKSADMSIERTITYNAK